MEKRRPDERVPACNPGPVIPMMGDVALLAGQFLCLLLTAAGWGVWIWLLAGRPAPFRQLAWLWCSLAGFCAHTLALQGLLYLNQPLAWTAWLGMGIAIAGGLTGIWLAATQRATGMRVGRIDARLLLVVWIAAFAVESAGVIAVGTRDFYGKGRYDQANYVTLAQFLADRPFATEISDIGPQPWLARPLELKDQRITQSVAHGALAVVSGGDAQRGYGAMTAFFASLVAVAVAAWLRRWSVPRPLAAIGGLGAALGPAVTNLHLDGYFSQTSTLFVLPALVAVLGVRRPLNRLEHIVAALLLAFWIGAYSEVAVVGVAVVGVLRLTARGPWPTRIRELLWIGAGALVVNPGYGSRLVTLLLMQWTQVKDPHHLELLVPGSGTWWGWSRLFLDLPVESGAKWLMFAAGGVVLALMAWATLRLPPCRRTLLWVTLSVPVALLAWLAIQPVLAKYPFAKLLAGFAPLWIGTAMLGLVALGRMRRWQPVLFAAALLGAGAVSTVPFYRDLIRGEGVLAELNSPALHRVRDEASRHRERSFLVVADHPLVAQWICYFARHSNVYLDRRHLGDRIVPSETYPFRRLPASKTPLWWLDPQREGPVASHQPACRLHVRGAVETGTITSGPFYVMPDSLQLEIDRPARQPAFAALWLDMVGLPLTGTTPLELELSGPSQPRQHVTLTSPRMLRFHLILVPGKNEFVLRAVSPVAARESRGTLIVQSLSLDPITPVQLASDPAPAEFVR